MHKIAHYAKINKRMGNIKGVQKYKEKRKEKNDLKNERIQI